MSVTFDPAKRKANLKKHGIDLAECDEVFDHPMLTQQDSRDYSEERLVSIGLLRGAAVTLIWTERDAGPHLISCRKANRHDQEAFFKIFPRH